MSIVLPESQEQTARQRAAELGITPEQYLAELVELEAFKSYWATLTPEEQAAHLETERLLDEALASGPPITVDDAWLESKLRALRERRTMRASRQNPA